MDAPNTPSSSGEVVTLEPADVEAVHAARRGEPLPPELVRKLATIVQAAADGQRIKVVHTRIEPPVLADAAMSAIKGCQDTQRLVFALKDGMAPADTLLEGLQAVEAIGDPERLRGFARELQKRLERGA